MVPAAEIPSRGNGTGVDAHNTAEYLLALCVLVMWNRTGRRERTGVP